MHLREASSLDPYRSFGALIKNTVIYILVLTFSMFRIVESVFLSTFNKVIGRFIDKPNQLFALFYQSESFSSSQLLNTEGFVAQILPSSAKSRRISSRFSAVCFAQNPPDLSDLPLEQHFFFFSCCLCCVSSHSIRRRLFFAYMSVLCGNTRSISRCNAAEPLMSF